MNREGSRLRLAAQLVALVVACGVLGVLLAQITPTASFAAALLAAGVGVALIARHSGARAHAEVIESSGGKVLDYPVRIPLSRWAMGSLMQTKLNKQYAPGVLGARSGYAEFFPSKPKDDGLAWAGPVNAVQLRSVAGRSCAIRVHGPAGSLQFTTVLLKADVESALAGTLSVVDGWTEADPTR